MDPIAGYNAYGAELAARYERLRAEDVHAAFLSLLAPGSDRLALDIGAGSGRDAAWLEEMGFDVVAVEPARGMREAASTFHGRRGIRWVDDRLPALIATHRLGLAFDVILLSGVFMHVPPDHRPRAFRKIVTLLKPGARLLISVRDGAGSPDRPNGKAFRALLVDRVTGQDLRIGAPFTGERAAAVAEALADARTNISRMPAHFNRYRNSETPVFDAAPARAPKFRAEVAMAPAILRSFGDMPS